MIQGIILFLVSGFLNDFLRDHLCLMARGTTYSLLVSYDTGTILSLVFYDVWSYIIFSFILFSLYDKYSLTDPFIVLLLLNNTRVRPR